MKHPIPGHPAPDPKGYPCSGTLDGWHNDPPHAENRYHPAQVAWLTERGLYTGRMVADVAHLPTELKFLDALVRPSGKPIP